MVGSRHVEELDKGLGLRPFYQEPGWTLSVYAKLPGSILDVTDESRVEAAVASDGSSLLKGDRDWDLRLQQPKLSKDGASVLFEVNLKKPGEGVSGLKELSGVMSYRVSGKTKKVDLGFDVLEKGAKGGELGAVLEDVGDGKLELKVNVGSKDLVGAWLRDEGGLRELSRRGSWGSNRTTTFTFETEDGDGIPEKGTVVLELHDGVKVFEAPFKLENIDLLGNPMK